jgi:predicted DNA-binding protein
MIRELTDHRRDTSHADRGKSRMTVDLTPEFRERLEKLEAKTYLGNKATVIRHALAIYEYLVEMTESGSEIVVRSPKGEERHLDRITLAIAS